MFLALLALTLLADPATRPVEVPAVKVVGSRQHIIDGDLGGRMRLGDLPPGDVVGVGPIEGLLGEVTILDGELHVGVLDDNGQPLDLPPDVAEQKSAIFLAYSIVPDWASVEIEPPADLAGLQSAIETAATEQGMDLDATPFAVKIRGNLTHLRYHIMWRVMDADHPSPVRVFERQDVEATLVGFYTRTDADGHYSHPGKPLHLHAVLPSESDDAATVSGHVEAASFGGETLTIMLPATK